MILLSDQVFDCAGLSGFKSWDNAFFYPARFPFVFCCFPSLFFLSMDRYCGVEDFTDRVSIALSTVLKANMC